MKNTNQLSKLKFLASLIFLHFSFVFIFGFLHCFAETTDEKKPIIIGFDADFPPMGFTNESGEACGADVEFMNLAAKQMGREIKFQPIDWDAKELELSSGKIDAIANGLSKTPERAESMTLTEPYMENGQVVVVKKGSGIKKLADLKNKQVCLQKGSSAEHAFESSQVSKSVGNVVKLSSCVDCLNEVKQGKVDGAIVDEAVARFYLQKLNNDKTDVFEILSEVLASEVFVVAVKKGNEALKNEIEKAFEKISDMEETKKISVKWFGKPMFKFKKTSGSYENEKSVQNSGLFNSLFAGFAVTMQIFVWCLVFSMPLGLVCCLLRLLKSKVFNCLIYFYIALMRGTPLLLQLLFAFYGLPLLVPGLVLKSRFLVGLIVFILNYAAYFAEIFRGSLNSISRGQFEAIEVFQISKFKALFRIIIPQMLRVCLPSICNETVALVKDTALIFSIGVVELLTTVKNLVNSTANVSFYFIAAVIYFLICSLLIFIFNLIEKKLSYVN